MPLFERATPIGGSLKMVRQELRVTLDRIGAKLEHYVAGGMTHTFKRKQMVWDVGVHCLGEMEAKRMPGRVLRWLSPRLPYRQ